MHAYAGPGAAVRPSAVEADLQPGGSASVRFDLRVPPRGRAMTSGAGQVGGATLTAEIRITSGPEGVSAYAISLVFDADLGDELDVLEATEWLPLGFSFSFTPGVTRIQESSAVRPGQILTFEAATLGFGPASATFAIGQIVLRATSALSADGPDLVLGLWNAGVDGLFDNAGNDLGAAARFGSAAVVPLPEPGSAALLALGLAALARRPARGGGVRR